MLKNTNPFLNAFLKLCVVTKKINVSMMSAQVSLDTGYLSRIFNNQFQLRKERNLYKICHYLELDAYQLLKTDRDFERFCKQFKQAFYYCDPSVHQLYERLLQYEQAFDGQSPYYVPVLLLRMMYEMEAQKRYPYALVNTISKIMGALPEEAMQIVWTYFVLADAQFPDFERSGHKDVFYEASRFSFEDLHLKARLYYFGLSYFRKYHRPKYVEKCYLKAREGFRQTQNVIMQEKLSMKFSSLLRSNGHLRQALHNDLQLLYHYRYHHYQFRNVEILYNNIAWTYLLLHDYAMAAKYYECTLRTLKDNEIYFNLAYCFYRLGKKQEALEYIALGRLAKGYAEYVYLLLEWLEAMINRRYSKKSFGIVYKVLKLYGSHLDIVVKDMLQIEIVNYFYYNKFYLEALQASAPLIGRKIMAPNQLIVEFKKHREKER